ncbi:helix-turn-helix domain-containing protein [uncultured Limosilactobacillus sp.]|uniref:helix-turn-helix domain-containing protein n=1 Tax=uncultured Limosilactobacillus sp. TaxID=2837629 RepID=UPI0025F64682|nr:helix-turn-helix transcriptional regulator [uncultured Limosilactobacillus sp.]
MINNRIRQLRQNKGLTLQGLSQALKERGVKLSASSLIKYERNERTPSLETWVNLAKFFDVPVGYIQGKSISPYLIGANDSFEQIAHDYALFENVDGELSNLTKSEQEKISDSIVTLKTLIIALVEDNELRKSPIYKQYLLSICELLQFLALPLISDKIKNGSERVKSLKTFNKSIKSIFEVVLNSEVGNLFFEKPSNQSKTDDKGYKSSEK